MQRRCSLMTMVLLAGWLAVLGGMAWSAEPELDWQAKWICRPGAAAEDYNDWTLARRVIVVEGNVQQATIGITADTTYQLSINGRFVCDGPVRAFPQHYRYDPVDVTRFLQSGTNVISVRMHYWGRDTAKSIAIRPGLLAQLDWHDEAGRHVVGTDRSWRVRRDPSFAANAPAVSAHLGFEEQYDARAEFSGWQSDGYDDAAWDRAEEIAPAQAGPWLDLRPREIPQLTKEAVAPIAVLNAQRVRPPRIVSTLNLGRCQGIDRKAANLNFFRFVLVTTVRSSADQQATVFRPSAAFEFGSLRFPGQQLDVQEDLLQREQATVDLKQGDNVLIVMLDGRSEIEEFQFSLDAEQPVSLHNPLGQEHWALAGPFEPKDSTWQRLRNANSLDELKPFADQFRDLEPREIIGTDVHGLTCFRKVLGPGAARIENSQSLLVENEEMTVIPAGDEDLELMIDLGKEYNAHLGFEIDAPSGVVLDSNVFERFHDGAPQWSWRNRSGFRYVTRAGWQRYVTTNHFGGRYLALTVRARPEPVRIRQVFALSTHYPVADRGRFHCSDALLNNVWSISRQTMLSCMEDTFVDCPLYEQSFWLGDSRNEALVCYMMFGDSRLVSRCCTLGCESLEHGDLVAMRVPTRWGRVIPAWSFLWLRMCWENYWYTGDKTQLSERYYPAVRTMLETSLDKYLDPQTGLFTIQAWQFFDWIGLDNGHRCVTHNNTFLVDSLRIGARMADVAGDEPTAGRFRQAADQLTKKINEQLWDEQRGAYIDSIHNDGSRSTSISRQINTLALLHGVVPKEREQRVLAIALGEQQEGVVQFGSPFATLYLLELLGETGRVDAMLDVIREQWGGMMDEQTTTFWESFAVGNLGGNRYPTRSYCHAWSAGPAYVFSRYVLGAELEQPGGGAITLTPQLDVLPRAEGVIPLPQGAVEVSWNRDSSDLTTLVLRVTSEVQVTVQLPPGWQTTDSSTATLVVDGGKRQVLQLVRSEHTSPK